MRLTSTDIDICIVFSYISKLSYVLHTHTQPLSNHHFTWHFSNETFAIYIYAMMYVKRKKEIKIFIMRYEKKWLFLGFNRVKYIYERGELFDILDNIE